MVNSELIRRAKNKGLITKYSDFCKSEKSQKYALSREEIIYYISIKNINLKKGRERENI